jgi:hypothetical protein
MLKVLERRGAPVRIKSAPWSSAQIREKVHRGPHKSAIEYADFLRDELVAFIRKSQWTVLPLSVVLNDPALRKALRISPMGIVPQRDRRPRVIVDYSFFGLNDDTIRLGPPEAMQFGKALERLLHQIVNANPQFGPVHLIKVDIADGFYRIWVNTDDIPKLAVSLPPLEGTEPLLALPLVLPMGWTQSPPLFCAATETATDMANLRLKRNWKPGPHRLDAVAESQPAPEPAPAPSASIETALPLPEHPPIRTWKRKALAKFDVFVDDFIGIGQGDPKRLMAIRQVLLHTIDDLFRPLDAADSVYRNEPSSTKKLGKGDGAWATRKIVLGWLIDTIAMTIELPPHRQERLREILADIKPDQKRTSVRKWQQVLGELRSMAIAIPGARGIFSLMQEALRHADGHHRIRLSRGVHDCLDDFRWMSNDLQSRPTRLFELVPQAEPDLLGACDASGRGMGGVWFPTTGRLLSRKDDDCDGAALRSTVAVPLQSDPAPIVWRASFPASVSSQLVSDRNPTGTITNSDLELAATLVHKDVAAQQFDIRERTIVNGSDNTPAVAWQRKGSTTTTAPPAYLLRAQSLHQRFHRYHSTEFYIPGPSNVMADDASRLLHLSPSQLLAHFELTYPQTHSWRFASPRTAMLSTATSALHSERPAMASLLQPPPPLATSGKSGSVSALTSASTQSWTRSKIPSSCYRSSRSVIARAPSLPAVSASDLGQWRPPFVRWARRWPAWGPPTRG